MKKLLITVIMVFMSGCATISSSDFEKPDPNVVANIKVEVKLEKGKVQKIAPNIAVPIIKSIVGLGFDFFMDYQIEKLESLKKAAQNQYAATIILDDKQEKLTDYSRINILRFHSTAEGNITDLNATLKISHYNNAITITPVYIKVNNPTVITKKLKEKNNKIDLSFGLSIKTIAKKQDNAVSLATSEGVVSVPNIEIGENAKAFTCKGKECPTSDLIPYNENTMPISITLSIAEKGQGVNIDQYKTELEAIKKAMGPVVQTSVGELLKK